MKRREREEKTKAFWEKKDLSIRSMLLNDDAEELDRLERPEILSYLPSWEGKSVLDLPCGTGRFTSEFAPRASRVVAVDLCSHFLQQSRQVNKSYRNIEYLQSDAMDLSFPDASFDLIFMSWLLQYLEDTEIEAFASRLAAWLKPLLLCHLPLPARIPPFFRGKAPSPHRREHQGLRGPTVGPF